MNFQSSRLLRLIKLILYMLFLIIIALSGLRFFDWYSDQTEWKRLQSMRIQNPQTYDPKIISDLPEPTRRFFNYAIKPGTPLLTVAEIEMKGQFSLGSKEQPNYQNMQAEQILAAPFGFVWKVFLPEIISISGSDSGLWTRFRVLDLIPVARIGDDQNHRRAAFGRYVAEAVFWTPAALLPSPYIIWKQLSDHSSRMTITRSELIQSVDIEVNQDGQPISVHFLRWSDANPEKKYQLQPFGGSLSDFREIQGFRIPFEVDAGNMYGTENYFPFFKARLKSIRFLN